MPHYKDQSGALHFLDSADFAYLLPAGCVEITDEEAEALSAPLPTQAQIIAALEAAVQAHMDAQAQGAGYDSLLSAVSYAGSAKFGAQAAAFIAWRDACWSYCYAIEAAVQAGTQTVPTAAALVAGLPPITIPAVTL